MTIINHAMSFICFPLHMMQTLFSGKLTLIDWDPQRGSQEKVAIRLCQTTLQLLQRRRLEQVKTLFHAKLEPQKEGCPGSRVVKRHTHTEPNQDAHNSSYGN